MFADVRKLEQLADGVSKCTMADTVMPGWEVTWLPYTDTKGLNDGNCGVPKDSFYCAVWADHPAEAAGYATSGCTSG